jgi:pimeloyl-ACP methyl ester carboxylesterase
MAETLRTPEDRFRDLPDFPFRAHFLEISPNREKLQMHFLDEGRREVSETFLCLHGEPTWSYLYRKMIPVFTQSGSRVIAPDLIGFGRSDKFAEEEAYSFEFHRQSLLEFVERLDLKNITLVCQDWGGLLGLTLPMEMPERFSRLIVMNTAIAGGDLPLGRGFLEWRAWAAANPDMDIARLMKRSVPHLSDEEAKAYAAPFPDSRFKAGARAFPKLVPDHPDAPGAKLSRQAREWWNREWNGQAFMAVGMQDPILGPKAMSYLHTQIKNCLPPFELPQAGHFVQEWGDLVAKAALEAFCQKVRSTFWQVSLQ